MMRAVLAIFSTISMIASGVYLTVVGIRGLLQWLMSTGLSPEMIAICIFWLSVFTSSIVAKTWEVGK